MGLLYFLLYIMHVKVAVSEPHAACFISSGGQRKFAKQTVNTAQRLQFMNRNVQIGTFVKICYQIIGRVLIVLCNFTTVCFKYTYNKHYIQVRAEYVHHFDYSAKYSLKQPI
jgi:hypothetical protein